MYPTWNSWKICMRRWTKRIDTFENLSYSQSYMYVLLHKTYVCIVIYICTVICIAICIDYICNVSDMKLLENMQRRSTKRNLYNITYPKRLSLCPDVRHGKMLHVNSRGNIVNRIYCNNL